MTVDIYSRYFRAECLFHEVARRAVIVKLTCESGGGEVRYLANVSFFPHRDEEDYAVSYDAYAEKEVFRKTGRRSKKQEAELLEGLQAAADELAENLGGRIFWDQPLREAQMG